MSAHNITDNTDCTEAYCQAIRMERNALRKQVVELKAHYEERWILTDRLERLHDERIKLLRLVREASAYVDEMTPERAAWIVNALAFEDTEGYEYEWSEEFRDWLTSHLVTVNQDYWSYVRDYADKQARRII